MLYISPQYMYPGIVSCSEEDLENMKPSSRYVGLCGKHGSNYTGCPKTIIRRERTQVDLDEGGNPRTP